MNFICTTEREDEVSRQRSCLTWLSLPPATHSYNILLSLKTKNKCFIFVNIYFNYLIFKLVSSSFQRLHAPLWNGWSPSCYPVQYIPALFSFNVILNPQFSIAAHIHIMDMVPLAHLMTLLIQMNLENWASFKVLTKKDIPQTDWNPRYGVILLPLLKMSISPIMFSWQL